MEQRTGKEIRTINYVCRRLIDKSTKNWGKVSFNDFGVKYDQDFREKMKNAKPIRLKRENITCE